MMGDVVVRRGCSAGVSALMAAAEVELCRHAHGRFNQSGREVASARSGACAVSAAPAETTDDDRVAVLVASEIDDVLPRVGLARGWHPLTQSMSRVLCGSVFAGVWPRGFDSPPGATLLPSLQHWSCDWQHASAQESAKVWDPIGMISGSHRHDRWIP